MKRIDLNADMGEGFGSWKMGADADLMPLISSANVACGGHAGDPNVMSATVRLAHRHGVAVGAHPSYPDLPGFGRRSIPMSREEITRSVLYQLGALWAIARAEGVALHHIKPHGALYNDASVDEIIAEAVVDACTLFSTELLIYALPGSTLARVGADKGLKVALEGFADRAYQPNGLLADRKMPGAVHSHVGKALAQAISLAEGHLETSDGSIIAVNIATICLHSDTPGAGEMARLIRSGLTNEGYTIAPPE
ncbi:MAG: LamB/YcsF family protein [Chloroflexota bacterium]|nr:LamB/YcsF family protein [Chloroflexota bacterium]